VTGFQCSIWLACLGAGLGVGLGAGLISQPCSVQPDCHSQICKTWGALFDEMRHALGKIRRLEALGHLRIGTQQ
jgi:hypothetical protein